MSWHDRSYKGKCRLNRNDNGYEQLFKSFADLVILVKIERNSECCVPLPKIFKVVCNCICFFTGINIPICMISAPEMRKITTAKESSSSDPCLILDGLLVLSLDNPKDCQFILAVERDLEGFYRDAR